jgi:hypothetical protein
MMGHQEKPPKLTTEELISNHEPFEFGTAAVLLGGLAVISSGVAFGSAVSGNIPEAVGSGLFAISFAAGTGWNWALMHQSRE